MLVRIKDKFLQKRLMQTVNYRTLEKEILLLCGFAFSRAVEKDDLRHGFNGYRRLVGICDGELQPEGSSQLTRRQESSAPGRDEIHEYSPMGATAPRSTPLSTSGVEMHVDTSNDLQGIDEFGRIVAFVWPDMGFTSYGTDR